MKPKLSKKIFFSTFSVIVLSLAVMMLILSLLLNNYAVTVRKENLTAACEEVNEYLNSTDKSVGISGVYSTLKALSNLNETDIFICDNSGKIIVCGCETRNDTEGCPHTAVTVLQNEIEDGTKNKNGVFVSTLGIYGEPHYVACRELSSSDGNRYATVFASSSVSDFSDLLPTITKIFLLSAVIPLIIMSGVIYGMTNRLTKPLKLMSEASKAMAAGDFSKRIPVMSDDEIGELSSSFNMLANSLSKSETTGKSFVANVSHELRTPMTTIGGFIDGILDGTIEPDKQDYYLNIVSDEIKRLSRIVESMLSMAKLESGEFNLSPELFDLRELICTIVISQEKRIEDKALQISGLDSIESISVNADKDLIHRVIYNLVDNAIKFTENGGCIDFALKRENKRVCFKIKNTGNIIDKKDMPYIFDRFYKVDKSRSANKNSTGLGLYIVKAIVTAHSGSITVSNEDGKFTVFSVVLPL